MGVLAEARVGPVAPGHADDRDAEHAVAFEVVERREQLALRQVAGGAEEDQDVGLCLHAHVVLPGSSRRARHRGTT